MWAVSYSSIWVIVTPCEHSITRRAKQPSELKSRREWLPFGIKIFKDAFALCSVYRPSGHTNVYLWRTFVTGKDTAGMTNLRDAQSRALVTHFHCPHVIFRGAHRVLAIWRLSPVTWSIKVSQSRGFVRQEDKKPLSIYSDDFPLCEAVLYLIIKIAPEQDHLWAWIKSLQNVNILPFFFFLSNASKPHTYFVWHTKKKKKSLNKLLHPSHKRKWK